MMKLFMSLTSPYARKVRVILSEKGIAFEPELALPWDPDSSVPNYNPLGKVPVLLLDGDKPVYDSRVIVQYLEMSYPEPALIPAEKSARLLVLRGEALADGMVDAAVAIGLERKRPEALRDQGWIERQLGKVDAAMKSAEVDLTGRIWWVDDHISLADIALGCALGYVDLRLTRDWRRQYPSLAALMERLNQRPSFADTVPPQ